MRLANALAFAVLGCAVTPTPSQATEPAEPSAETAPATPTPAEPVAVASPRSKASTPPVTDKPVTDKPARALKPIPVSDELLTRARKVQPIVARAAAEHGIDPNFLNGVIWVESKFNPKARNRSGAKGLMQIMPKTGQAMAKKLGRRHRPYDPDFSIHAGAKLLSILLAKFDNDEELALLGYARGGGRARRYVREGGEMPEGVQKFILRVRRAQQTFKNLGFPDAG